MSELCRREFVRDLLRNVQGFRCGSHPWCLEVSDWIKSPDEGALSDMARFKTKVFLYEDANGDLVGYGSLGTVAWNFPDEGSPPPETPPHPMPGRG